MSSFRDFVLQPFQDAIMQAKAGNANAFITDYKYYTLPKFRAGQTGCSRRDINVWRKENLLPNALEENKWNLFSISECIWLRFVGIMKRFGVKSNIILQIKAEMFPDNIAALKNILENVKALAELHGDNTGIIDEQLSEIDKVPEEIMSEQLPTGFDYWACIVMLCCKLHLNYTAVIHEDGDYLFMNIGKPLKDNKINLPELIMKQLSNRSFLLINISELCKDFFDNDKVIIDNAHYFGLMNDNEQRVITELRTGKYKQITIKLDNGSITHLNLTKRDSDNEETIRKLSRLFKTNDFKDIELLTRNGEIIKYSETDIVKLKK